jgi:LssY-like putative type I secretion system component LssY
MTADGWYPADPVTFRSSVRIAADWVFRRPYDDAPVSNLELFGRRQDLAFEQPIGNNLRQRDHVRFWRWDHLQDGREVWFGAATLCPDVDAERDRILSGLQKGGQTQEVYWVPGFHTVLQGKNGAGDPWYTDGRLGVAVLVITRTTPVEAEFCAFS